jgi:hypothetical protein
LTFPRALFSAIQFHFDTVQYNSADSDFMRNNRYKIRNGLLIINQFVDYFFACTRHTPLKGFTKREAFLLHRPLIDAI